MDLGLDAITMRKVREYYFEKYGFSKALFFTTVEIGGAFVGLLLALPFFAIGGLGVLTTLLSSYALDGIAFCKVKIVKKLTPTIDIDLLSRVHERVKNDRR